MNIKLLFLMLISFSVYGQEFENEFTPDWQTFYSSNEILIEVKTVQEEIATREQNLIVFKIENLTYDTIKTSFKQHVYRGNHCQGCTSLNNEYNFELTLAPKEVLDGSQTLKDNKALCVFNTFVNLVPGMSNQSVDKIDFVNLNVIKL